MIQTFVTTARTVRYPTTPTMTRCCPCCRMPGTLADIRHGRFEDQPVVFGVCLRCTRANAKLPPGTRQKRLNAAAALAATDTTACYWTARFSDPDTAALAAAMLKAPITAAETADALGWKVSSSGESPE